MTNKLLLSPLLSLEQCRELVSKTDWTAALEFVSQTRRQEFLTWRAVLYQWLGRVVDIAYKDGAPTVVGSNINIGVSHTTDMVAVVVSQTPCAVDVERRDRDVSRVAERFFTEREQQIAQSGQLQVAVWCARECYYKFMRDRAIDILNDIHVTHLDIEQGRVTVQSTRAAELEMKIEQTAEHIVVYVL